jgi:hypothetical protein
LQTRSLLEIWLARRRRILAIDGLAGDRTAVVVGKFAFSARPCSGCDPVSCFPGKKALPPVQYLPIQ